MGSLIRTKVSLAKFLLDESRAVTLVLDGELDLCCWVLAGEKLQGFSLEAQSPSVWGSMSRKNAQKVWVRGRGCAQPLAHGYTTLAKGTETMGKGFSPRDSCCIYCNRWGSAGFM